MMFKYESKKRAAYYDEAVRLYYEEHLGCHRIAKIFSLSKNTISNWIRNFAEENPQNELVMKRQGKLLRSSASVTLKAATPQDVHSQIDVVSQEATEPSQTDPTQMTDVNALQAEIKRLKKALEHESLRADVYDEMINVAEQQFGISIRKKAGTK